LILPWLLLGVRWTEAVRRVREGVFLADELARGPVPVRDKSLTPVSVRRGEGRLAMFDFGESRTLVLEMERVKRAMRLTLLLWMLSEAPSWTSWVLGVEGEGVRGMRPPAR
jgi:hypothetical protein